MGAAVLKQQFEAVLGGHLDWQSRPAPECVPSGTPGIDLPRGGLTEIFGPASSGRASLLISILAAATAREEVCVLVDAEDEFDPASAARISDAVTYNTSSSAVVGEVSLRVAGKDSLVLATKTPNGDVYSACLQDGTSPAMEGRNDTSDPGGCSNGWLNPP